MNLLSAINININSGEVSIVDDNGLRPVFKLVRRARIIAVSKWETAIALNSQLIILAKIEYYS